MIVRPPQHWFVRLFTWHGSVMPQILFRLLLNLGMSLIALALYPWLRQHSAHLTLPPFSLLGIAIAIFLGFRNNASYSRYVEARKIWGSMMITSRSLIRQTLCAVNEAQSPKLAAKLLIAYAWTLNHSLRGSAARQDLQRLIDPSEADVILNKQSMANMLLLKVGQFYANLLRQGKVTELQYRNIDENLNELSRCLGGCERITNTPVPFAYSLILQRTVYLFCTLLPLALVADLHWLTPFVSVFISYTFLSWDAVAEEMEHPFGEGANNLALDAICTGIERNLLEMTEQTPLPPLKQVDRYYNLT
ncbi:bestrophin family protein [Rosenbergiella nectarea]|uniref:bestrophin family protein n=1 Tax=Rosenbergiella nectarea TaxID=988801 RepID=UPI001BD955F2|nr:bestrophin family ion channel [Rosenbergiella nectarea]MBT0729217.1 ibestrophin [Rosenbergiella nectarea subsp. apis]